jgi:hypothetical protein
MSSWAYSSQTAARRRRIAVAVLWSAALVVAGCERQKPDPSARIEQLEKLDLDRSQVRMDPGLCPDGGDGHVYFALGQQVVRVPNAGVIHVGRDLDPKIAMWIPPNPAAQEGCRDNPLKVQILHLAQHQQAILPPRHSFGSQPLATFNLLRQGHMGSNPSGAEALLASVVKRTPCKKAGGDMVECVKPNPTPTTPSVLTVRPATYATPMRRPFIVMCGFGPGIYNDECSVRYQFDERTAVHYRMDRGKIPASGFIDLDRAVREGISAMIVKSYPWKEASK